MSGLITRRSAIIGAGAALAAPHIARALPRVWTPPLGLEYPAGRAPGFDPTHLAAQNCRFSGVATSGGGFVDLKSGMAFTPHNSPTTTISTIGPAVQTVAGSSQYLSRSGYPAVTDSVGTIGIIGTANTGAANAWFESGGSNRGWLIRAPSGNLQFVSPTINQINSPWTLSYGVPYFMVVSGGGGRSTNFVLVNLLTGQTYSYTGGSVASGGISDGNYLVGYDSVSYSSTGLAAAMYSAAYFSLSLLLAWAKDLWGFWYQ